ncbi:hypothetical protein ARMGADRAFT_1075105 [Armillaria gallica]|uniref:Uncharacterized protein n=1 Tax=Armillaria gallica TaxID=47427 RepID=A0A2H3DSP7_ARMGA|nr:hypothetical protein ARMGADRAFT_1075105 [Armillaria gallica]
MLSVVDLSVKELNKIDLASSIIQVPALHFTGNKHHADYRYLQGFKLLVLRNRYVKLSDPESSGLLFTAPYRKPLFWSSSSLLPPRFFDKGAHKRGKHPPDRVYNVAVGKLVKLTLPFQEMFRFFTPRGEFGATHIAAKNTPYDDVVPHLGITAQSEDLKDEGDRVTAPSSIKFINEEPWTLDVASKKGTLTNPFTSLNCEAMDACHC